MNHATSAEQHFQAAIATAGLTPPDTIIADGAIHRFSTNGKATDDSGWYSLHLDNIPAGAFGNWRDGRTIPYCSRDRNTLSPSQRTAFDARIADMKAHRAAAQKAEHEAAARVALAVWETASKPPDKIDGVVATDTAPQQAAHRYLQTKGVQPCGARLIEASAARALSPTLSPTLDGPLLVVPMRNAAGKLRSLQFIMNDGTKRPLTGGEKKGCYCLIGAMTKPSSPALIERY